MNFGVVIHVGKEHVSRGQACPYTKGAGLSIPQFWVSLPIPKWSDIEQ